MSNLMKYYENTTDIIYALNGQGLVSIPKELKDNIKVFMAFIDGISNDNINQLMHKMQEISRNVNKGDNEGVFIFSLIDTKTLQQDNAFIYTNELDKIKKLINTIYNKMLEGGNLKKENFVKQVNVLSLESKYNNFINWLCRQEPTKFFIANYQQSQILNNTEENRNVFINNTVTGIFNEPNRQNAIGTTQSNINPIPINETLSINNSVEQFNVNSQYTNEHTVESLSQPKKLVKTLTDDNHKSAAFIKWYTTLFILVTSLVIGITISIFLVK